MGTLERPGRPGAPDVVAVYELSGGRLRARQGTKPIPEDDVSLARRACGAVKAVASSEPYFCSDIRESPGIAPGRLERRGVISACWLPLMVSDQVVSVVALGWTRAVDPPTIGGWDPASLVPVSDQIATTTESIGELAMVDPLTGLPNRAAWLEQLDRDLARSAREGSAVSLGLVDIDDFRSYNATHGHEAGDALLRRLGEAWRGMMRLSDYAARVGPDELGLILPSCEPGDAIELIDRLRGAVGGPTCSAAVAAWDGGEDSEALIRRLDQAIYRAKQTGRGRTEFAGGAATASGLPRG